ncbi:hypothetical protein Tco_1170093, partial [Tanacetum coccineum]
HNDPGPFRFLPLQGRQFSLPLDDVWCGVWIAQHGRKLPLFYVGEKIVEEGERVVEEAMASPKQTAIGKDSSNPFMAGSLPKTTLCVNL